MAESNRASGRASAGGADPWWARLAPALAVAAIVTAAGVNELAADDAHHWINPLGGDYQEPDNWDQEAVPGSDAALVFDLDASYTVLMTPTQPDFSSVRSEYLFVRAGDVTLDMTPAGLWAGTSTEAARVVVGAETGDDAALTLINNSGSLRQLTSGWADVSIGREMGSVGSITVNNDIDLRTFTSAGGYAIRVGQAGTGTLIVNDGGRVDTAGAEPPGIILGDEQTGQGTLIVDGGQMLKPTIVGRAGTGALTVSNGGSASISRVAAMPGSVGAVTVTGSNALGTASEVTGVNVMLALNGQGSILAENGATLRTEATHPFSAPEWVGLSIGGAIGSEGHLTIRDPGTQWFAGNVEIGFSSLVPDHVGGHGTLTIENGATANTWQVFLGSGETSSASVIVRGQGTRWTTAYITVGTWGFTGVPVGSGELTIADGATVTSNGGGVIGMGTAQGTATVTDPGTTWTNRRVIVASGGVATFENHARVASRDQVELYGGGRLMIRSGAAMSVGTLDTHQELHDLADDSLHVQEDGLVFGDGNIEVASLINAGRVLAQGAGPLRLTGDYQQHDGGTLAVELGGGATGRLAVSGHASLAGTLELRFAGDASDPLGQPTAVLTAETFIDGEFDQVSAEGRDDVLLFVDYAAQAVSITAAMIGDMNLDGQVNTADVAAFVLALTDPATYVAEHGVDEATMIALGDINQDGTFGTADVAPFVDLLVGSATAATAETSVPEPGSLALLGLGALALLRRGRA